MESKREPGSVTVIHSNVDLIIRQVSLIDQARSRSELRDAVLNILKAIGVYTNASRTYVFDLDELTGLYTYTYEWCKAGAMPQQDQVPSVRSSEMPVWHAAFSKGKNIVIPDVEAVRKEMPDEYEFLTIQGIHSLIAVPIRSKGEVSGFIGLDDPDFRQVQSCVNLLTVIGGHIGNAKANFLTDAMLQNERNILKATIEELQKERQYLSVLCADYTSVYSLNLNTETIELLKIDADSNISRLLSGGVEGPISYMPVLRRYAEQFVKEGPKMGFVEALSPENLKRELKNKDRYGFRYVSVPNSRGKSQFEVQVTKIPSGDGSFRAIVGFRHIDDVVKEELRHQKELETTLLDAQLSNEIISTIGKIYLSIYRIDLQADFYEEISSNTDIHRLTGRSGKASVKMMEICDTFVSPEYRNRVRQFFHLSTLPERMTAEETLALEYVDDQGNWHMARFIVKKRDAKGKVTHVLYCTRSISEMKRREENWINMAEEASRANAAKSDFLSRMAHDIRTPMNAVMGFVDIARTHVDDPQQVMNDLSKIEMAGRYIQQLVNDVLDISRIESGALKILPVPCSVTEIFGEFSQYAEAMQTKKRIHYCGHVHDIVSDGILADPVRLKQIFMNLLSNAVKFTPDGGSVYLDASEEALEGGRVRLSVTIQDTGIGMTPEFMKDMYGKFIRAVDTRVNKVRGSGLGLAIVHQLVELMQGTIDADSAPGKGTTFRVTLEFPCAEAVPTETGEIPNFLHTCEGMRLLVAEDNDLNFEVAYELLKMHGIRCDRAEDGAVCVEKFTEAPAGTYDAILMDMQMPVMNGIDATIMIRSRPHPQAKSIPIIAMTANAFDEDATRCLDAGMNVHLTKPLDMKKLIPVLKSYKAV